MTNHTTAMTLREIREALGHTVPPPGVPEPVVQATRYVVSCLPEGHDDRITYSINIRYEGSGLFSVRHGLRQYSCDGEWAYEPDFDEDDAAEAEWLKGYRFGHDAAVGLAKKLASTLSYRGRSVADVLADAAVSAVSGAADSRQP
ncbi:hypothetical protein QA942_19710 [Streptomyces sp. B21-106]|uniref:hypothetical protein n=1 Tax=Streptomyces sp. B21-106 TaxID=3039418 RepID=UPI002FF1DAC5